MENREAACRPVSPEEIEILEKDPASLERHVGTIIGFIIMGLVGWVGITVTDNSREIAMVRTEVTSVKEDVREIKTDVNNLEDDLFDAYKDRVREFQGRENLNR